MEDITVEKAAVGIVGLIALNLVLKAVSNIFKTFLRPGKDLKKLGKWAVVTGATGKTSTSGHNNGLID
jgi:17beta-estradiol 17-dehydrogenase / very-long-chain 3-oxoacyl-CoA reductase